MPEPGPGEVLLRQLAVGLNYIDVYFRIGDYYAEPPFIPGNEGVGVIERAGEGANNFRVGARVAYCGGPMGAYAEYRTIPEKHLIEVPPFMSDAQAAAIMLKGLTARYLVRKSYIIQPGNRILVHAAAGGVGLLLCQWAKHLGSMVIGTVGSEDKAQLAIANGCDHAILYRDEDFVERVAEITGGRGVHVVYDSVGRDTFERSLDCLMPLGLMISYGQSSGPIPPIDISLLRDKGSLYLHRPYLGTFIADQESYIVQCAEMFDLIQRGKLKVHVNQTFYLSDAASVHRKLEAKETSGSTVMII